MTVSQLDAVAVNLGRLPKEPDRVIKARPRHDFIDWISGRQRPRPLADGRLEVLRAISASLQRRPGIIREDLYRTACEAGVTADELRLIFPTAALGIAGCLA